MYSPLFAWSVGRTPHYSLVYAVSQKHQVLIVAADSVVPKHKNRAGRINTEERETKKINLFGVCIKRARIIVQVSTLHRPAIFRAQ